MSQSSTKQCDRFNLFKSVIILIPQCHKILHILGDTCGLVVEHRTPMAGDTVSNPAIQAFFFCASGCRLTGVSMNVSPYHPEPHLFI